MKTLLLRSSLALGIAFLAFSQQHAGDGTKGVITRPWKAITLWLFQARFSCRTTSP